jgi:cytochrome c peroxidase
MNMDNPSWDDGSLAPIFIRLAWHSSGTYDKASDTGGSNGAGMRFEAEAADCENAGLHSARAFLEPIKRKFPGISYSDLWILAAYVGIEHTGGPKIAFRPGRVDWESETHLTSGGWCNPMPEGGHNRLPGAEKYVNHEAGVDADGRPAGWQQLCVHIRDEVFYRMGFDDREIVALLCGGHVYGRCHPTSSGYAGAWVEHPTKWSNEYATDSEAYTN